jgi:hypothetical protein
VSGCETCEVSGFAPSKYAKCEVSGFAPAKCEVSGFAPIETGIRLLESIRDLCLMVRSIAHVNVAKTYSDILGELRTMATKKRGVARDTWRSKEEARAELTRLQQCVLDKLEDAKCGKDLSLIIMALVMVSTDENDTLQPLRTGTADGLAYSGTPAATDDRCKGIVHVAEGEPVTLESIRHTKTGRVLSEPLDLDDGCPALATALRMHREHALLVGALATTATNGATPQEWRLIGGMAPDRRHGAWLAECVRIG